jgi:uncharacterized membrane protein YtjA (UPF0391 family)
MGADFLLISIVAGVLGFTGITAGAAEIAKILFFLFLALCAVFVALAVFAVGLFGCVPVNTSRSTPGSSVNSLRERAVHRFVVERLQRNTPFGDRSAGLCSVYCNRLI